MTEAAVTITGIGKRYRLAHQRERYGRLTESISGALRAPVDRMRGRGTQATEWFWALRDVSFEVGRGEVIGIVGRNGAGKTTLLKILAGITEPTTGQAVLRGRVSSLLEVGTGFHPELTGRENIYLSGSILGMRRREIDRRFDEIVDFAEVERFLDTPVKRYSSGMNVRLGFAVAAHLETEILIVDEVLAVGDVAFQKKCLAKMEDASHEGRTILFVSHNMPAVETLCTTGVLLEQGSMVSSGTAHEVVGRYLETAAALGASDIADRVDRQGDGRLRIVAIETSLRTGNPSELRFEYAGQSPSRNVSISVGLFTSRGEGALFLASEMAGTVLDEIPASGTIVCSFDRSGLLPGRYSMNVYCTVNGVLADWVIDAASIEVAEGDFFGTGKLPPPGYGSVAAAHRWSVEAR
jgi:lipopolysaccharide transport system ATP-binding protein